MEKSIQGKSFKNKTFYVEEIGKGTQAYIEKHQLIDNNILVAVKNYVSNDVNNDLNEGGVREINILQKLVNCPNIIQLLDVDFIILSSNIILRILTPYYEYDLDFFIHTKSLKIRLTYIEQIMTQLLEALNILHNRGIIHCDIKPPNILMDNNYNVYLADFGLSQEVTCDKNFRNLPLDIEGSYLYRAPEILTKNIFYTDKIDIWALGITLIEYLTTNIITEPRMDFLLDNPDKNNKNIIYEILTNCIHSYESNKFNYKRVKNYKIHTSIDINKILNIYMPDIIIPNNIITKLKSMLEINPYDRANITDLIKGINCPMINEMIVINELHENNNLYSYYDALYQMINICKLLNLKIITCYTSIVIYNHYVSNFKVDNDRKLKIITATCITLASKLYETVIIKNNKLILYYEKAFTENELRYMQMLLLKRFNYILTECQSDEIIHVLYKLTYDKIKYNNKKQLINVKMSESMKFSVIEETYTYPILLKTYYNMQTQNLFQGNMFCFEVIDIIEIYI